MTTGESITAIFVCVAASLFAVMLVNVYAGNRAEDGFRQGYIAGFAEAQAGLPSRHEYRPVKAVVVQP